MISPHPYRAGKRLYPIMGYYPFGYGYSTNPDVQDHLDNGYAYVIDGTQPFNALQSTIPPLRKVPLLFQTWGFGASVTLGGHQYVLFPTENPIYPTYVWKSNPFDPNKYDRITSSNPLPYSRNIANRASVGVKRTLTTSTAHNFQWGDYAVISGVGVGYDGNYTIYPGNQYTFWYNASTSINSGVVPATGLVELSISPTDIFWEVTNDYVFDDNTYTLYTLKGQGTATNAFPPVDNYFNIVNY